MSRDDITVKVSILSMFHQIQDKPNDQLKKIQRPEISYSLSAIVEDIYCSLCIIY